MTAGTIAILLGVIVILVTLACVILATAAFTDFAATFRVDDDAP